MSEQENTKKERLILGYDIGDLAITDLILLDFKNSWDYYNTNLQERQEIVSKIYSFIGIPITITLSILYLVKNEILKFNGFDANTFYPLLFVLSLIISIYGEIQLIALALEIRVSRNYLSFLNNIREYAGILSPELRPFLKFKDYENTTKRFLSKENISPDLTPEGRMKYISTYDEKYRQLKTTAPHNEKSKRLKNSYWHAAGAIFIVSLGFLPMATSLFIWKCQSSNATLGIILGITMMLLAYIINSLIFVRLSSGAGD